MLRSPAWLNQLLAKLHTKPKKNSSTKRFMHPTMATTRYVFTKTTAYPQAWSSSSLPRHLTAGTQNILSTWHDGPPAQADYLYTFKGHLQLGQFFDDGMGTASMHKVYHSFSNIICDVAPSQTANWFLSSRLDPSDFSGPAKQTTSTDLTADAVLGCLPSLFSSHVNFFF